MNLELVEGDLLDQDVDAIVNAWNRNIMLKLMRDELSRLEFDGRVVLVVYVQGLSPGSSTGAA